jgi:hypothetical protein
MIVIFVHVLKLSDSGRSNFYISLAGDQIIVSKF